jgi:predicted dehydrogenase
MKRTPRRKFLSDSARTAATLSAVAGVASRTRAAAPSERVRVAVIGVNGMGGFHVKSLAERDTATVATICDVDAGVAASKAQVVNEITGKTPKQVSDFRKVLDDPGIDAVVVATPHHWHVPIAIRALQAGKDVYLEKPGTHVFSEGRLLIEAARKYKRVVQHGTQMRTSAVTQRAGEVLESGLLGEIKTSKAWNVQRLTMPQPKPDTPVPPGVDYDMWLGPAPKRPFNVNRFHRNWRWTRDYGNGDMGDDGAHDIDMARWGLGVTAHPIRITAHGSRIDLKGLREYPDNMMVAHQYEEGKVLLYEDRLWTPYGMQGFDSGNAFYGTEGYMIFSRRGYFQTYLGPKEEKGPGASGKSLAGTAQDHMGNFLECVRTRAETHAPPEVAHLSCSLIHLGEIASRLERVLHFDPKTEKFRGDDEANGLLTKEYRSPWSIPDLA